MNDVTQSGLPDTGPLANVYIAPEGANVTSDTWKRVGTAFGLIVERQREAAVEEFARVGAPIMREITVKMTMAARTIHRLALLCEHPAAQRRQVMAMRAWSRRKGRRK